MHPERAQVDERPLRVRQQGLVDKAPAYNTLVKYAERAELAPLLKTLVQEAALPLRALETTFAVDSTRFRHQHLRALV
jgi:hypothetical protein